MKKLLIIFLVLALMILPLLSLAENLAPVDLSGPVQWDLTRLGYSMAYAQMYDMLVNPGNYLGHTVKLQGNYYTAVSEGAEESRHLILITDTAACCEIGMEFIVTGDNSAMLFPGNDTLIELTGVFSYFEEGGYTYPVLFVNEVIPVE